MAIKATGTIMLIRVNDGADGRSVDEITEEYYLSTSKTSQAGGSWKTAPDKWTSGKYMWTRSKIVYKNPAKTEYTTPVLDSSWEAIDGIEVGGRNLFTNSDYKKNSEGEVFRLSSWGGNKQTGVYDSDVPNGLKGLSEKRICTKSGTGGSYHDRDLINFIAGETFTVSFWAKGNNVTQSHYLVCFRRISDNRYIVGLPSYNLTDKWQKCQYTFTVKDGEEGVYSRRSIIYAESTVWLSHFKLEKGNKATDWTPAPEDIQVELDDKASNEHVDIIKGDLEKFIGTTEEGIETRVSEKYVEINTFNTISEKVTKMSQSIDGFDFTFDSKSLIDNLNEATGEAEKELQTIRKYIQFTSDGSIILGASDSPSKVEITREKISFKQNDKEVAWFSNQSFNIRSGTILTDLQVGYHKFEKSGTGRTQISYAKR